MSKVIEIFHEDVLEIPTSSNEMTRSKIMLPLLDYIYDIKTQPDFFKTLTVITSIYEPCNVTLICPKINPLSRTKCKNLKRIKGFYFKPSSLTVTWR